MSARDLYETIDKRIDAALGGHTPLHTIRGVVTDVATNGRLAARLEGLTEATQDIAYDLALTPKAGDDILILRRTDGFQLAIAILTRDEAVTAAPVTFIAAKCHQSGSFTAYEDVLAQVPLDVLDWDTDQMYASPGRLTVHYSGLYKLVWQVGWGAVEGGSGASTAGLGYSIYKNGVRQTTIPSDGIDLWLDGGDYFELFALLTTDGSGYHTTISNSRLELLGYAVQTDTSVVTGQAAPAVQAYHAATQSLATSTETALTLDSEDWDTDGYHSSTVNPSRLTVPVGRSGLYHITGQTFVAAGLNNKSLTLRKNGTTNLKHSGDWADAVSGVLTVDCWARLSAGEYVELVGWQNSGGALAFGHATARQWQTTLTMVATSTYPDPLSSVEWGRSIGARVGSGAVYQLLNNGAWTAVTFSQVWHDTDGFWTAALPTRLTVPASAPAGIYRVQCTVRFEPHTSRRVIGVIFQKNGGWVGERYVGNDSDTLASGDWPNRTTTLDLWLSPGDYVEPFAYQQEGGACYIGTNNATWDSNYASIAYLGTGAAAGSAVEGTEVWRSTAQSVGSGSLTGTTAVTFDSEAYDQADLWQASPNPTRVTAKETGWYNISGRGQWAANATGARIMHIYQPGVGNLATDLRPAISGEALYQGTSTPAYLTAGQYVTLNVGQNSGSSLDFYEARLRLVKMAAGAGSTYQAPVIEDAPGVAVYRTAALSMSNANGYTLDWGAEKWDTHGFWSSGAPSRFTIPAGHAGRYRFTWRWGFTGEAGVAYRLLSYLKVNGSEPPHTRHDLTMRPGAGYSYNVVNASAELVLAVGDYVELLVYQANDTAATAGLYVGNDSAGCSFTMTRLATGPQGEKGDPGADVFAEGTSFPTSPTVGQRFRRLDIRGGLLFFWNGTYWLTDNEYTLSGGESQAVSAAAYIARLTTPGDLDFYLTRVDMSAFTSTADGSNYWTLQLTRCSTAGNVTLGYIYSHTPGGAGWRRWAPWTTPALFAVANGDVALEMYATPTGVPGALNGQPVVAYRLRAT